MPSPVKDLAQLRLGNALLLFEEFVRATARHADAATLRGLERRFAERLQIQASYWSQIKARSRQIGERLARQFEVLCHKPMGWMDQDHSDAGPGLNAPTQPRAVDGTVGQNVSAGFSYTHEAAQAPYSPRDDDERFILGLVLTYYRRHPHRARTRLLDLLGEVLSPAPAVEPAAGAEAALPPVAAVRSAALPRPLAGPLARRPAPEPAPPPPSDDALWALSQKGVAPLKRKP